MVVRKARREGAEKELHLIGLRAEGAHGAVRQAYRTVEHLELGIFHGGTQRLGHLRGHVRHDEVAAIGHRRVDGAVERLVRFAVGKDHCLDHTAKGAFELQAALLVRRGPSGRLGTALVDECDPQRFRRNGLLIQALEVGDELSFRRLLGRCLEISDGLLTRADAQLSPHAAQAVRYFGG